MPSTVIRRFDYRDDRRELWIEFVTGRAYIYSNVPASVVQALRAAPSKGRYFNAHIRDHFAFREVTEVLASS